MTAFSRETWLELIKEHPDSHHDAPAASTGASSAVPADGGGRPGAAGADAQRASSAPSDEENALVRMLNMTDDDWEVHCPHGAARVAW